MSAVFPINEDSRFRLSTATEGQTEFSVPFPFQADEDIAVIVIDGVTGEEEELEPGGDYEIDGAGEIAGGMVTLAEGAADGDQYLRVGRAELTRLTAVTRQGRFNSAQMDLDLDRLTIIAQEIARELDRTVRVAYGETAPRITPGEEGQLLAFDADGHLVPQDGEGAPGADGAAATVAIGTVTTLSSGAPATVENVGTAGAAILDIGIPRGPAGAGSGDVLGPEGGADDGEIALFDGTEGNQLQGAGVTWATLVGDLADIVAAIDGKAASSHTHAVAELSDASANAKSILTAADYAAIRVLLALVADTDFYAKATAESTFARLAVEDQTIAGGARVTSKALGTAGVVSSGTLTPDPGDRPMQHYTANGAHTLAPGTNRGAYILDITNGAAAGAITTSGWGKVDGDEFTTTNNDKFRCHCSIGEAGSLLVVQALQ